MTRAEKLAIMHSIFGVTEGKQCKDCCHRICNERSRTYNKCECYGLSLSEATDFGVFQTACGLFNKETDVRDVYKRNTKRHIKIELQEETLF